MKKFLGLISLVLLFNSSIVFAGNDKYVKGNVGIFMMEDSTLNFESADVNVDIANMTFDTGFGLSVAAGQSLGNFDVELEFAYKNADFDKFEGKTFNINGFDITTPDSDLDDTIKIKTLMTNGIYNFKNNSSITPYIGAGLGIAWIDMEDFDGTEFAYQFLTGIDMAVNERLSLLVGYRYLGTGDISFEEYLGETYEVSATIDSHNLEVGLKYSF